MLFFVASWWCVASGLQLPPRDVLLSKRVLLSSSLGPGFLALAVSMAVDQRRFASAVEVETSSTGVAQEAAKPKFRRQSPIQFIAALGDPKASSGTGADTWGLWRDDPGPRGVWLRQYADKLEKTRTAPAGWTFDPDSWWLEEHGLIMPGPEPLPNKKFKDGAVVPSRKYVVTGDREVTTVLTVHADGRWELDKGTLYDVTHLPCRSARYEPGSDGSECTPRQADRSKFPVTPGAPMPLVGGCSSRDYAVLFVVGNEV